MSINQKHIAFIFSVLTVLIVGASVDMFVPSLPYIHVFYHTTTQRTQLIVATYLIAYGIFQLIAGSISDSFGRRKTLIFSLAGFLVATFLIPFSPNINSLLLLRFIQGLFAAGLGVSSRVLLSDTFKGNELARRASYLTFFWAIGPIFSPYLGGHLQHQFGWQSSFYVLGGYAFVVALLALFLLPETIKYKHRFHLSVMISNYRMVYFSKVFIQYALICGCAYSFITIYNVVGPFLIERTLSYSAIIYGRVALWLGVGWLSGNLLCRLIVNKQSPRKIICLAAIIGIIVSTVFLLLALRGHFNIWTVSVPPILLFAVGGMLFSYCFGKCLSFFPHIGGVASAAMGALYTVIAAFVSAVSVFLKSTHMTPLAIAYFIIIGLILLLLIKVRIEPNYDIKK